MSSSCQRRETPEIPQVGGDLQEEPEDVVADNLDLGEANNSPDNEIENLQAQLDRLKNAANKNASKGAVGGVQGSFAGASNIAVPMTNILRRDFKISRQIGNPNDRNTMTYISLLKQIDACQNKGFTASEIVEEVIVVKLWLHPLS